MRIVSSVDRHTLSDASNPIMYSEAEDGVKMMGGGVLLSCSLKVTPSVAMLKLLYSNRKLITQKNLCIPIISVLKGGYSMLFAVLSLIVTKIQE